MLLLVIVIYFKTVSITFYSVISTVHLTFIVALTKGLLVPGVNVAFSHVFQQPFLLLKARYHLDERND